MARSLSRRGFIGAAASAGLCHALTRVSSAAEIASAPPPQPAPPAAPRPDWPIWDAREETALTEVLNSGKWNRSSGGQRVKAFEAAFAQKMAARSCLATSSGTTALITALGACGVGPGDEVIIPPYTFVATFNAVTSHYALPVFADTDPATFQIDATKIAQSLTGNTRVLLPVHLGGSVCDLDAIGAIARSRSLLLLEDACQAPLAEWRGRPVGTFGQGGCFSFQASKNLTSGEGGAVLTNDETFAQQCYNFHTPGDPKPVPSFGRGGNFRLTEFQAGILLAQMTRIDRQFATREANAAFLNESLAKIPGIAPPQLIPGCTRNVYHLYMFRYDRRHFADLPRGKFMQALTRQKIPASGGYVSLPNSAHVRALASNAHYRRIYGKPAMARWLERNHCPANDRLCEEAVWLPQTTLLESRAEMERIAEAIAALQRSPRGV